MDELRRRENDRLSEERRRFIKGQRYNLLCRRESLTKKGRQALKLLFRVGKRLHKVYLLKESFGRLRDDSRPGWAWRSCESWLDALRWQRPEPIRKFAAMVEAHWDGIGAYFHTGNKTPLGFVEGLNDKLRAIQRPASGCRDEEYFRLKILTCMLPKVWKLPTRSREEPDMRSKDAHVAGETEQRLYLLHAWREAPFGYE